MNHIRLLQGFTLFTSTVLALGAQTTSDPGGLAGPASSGPRPTLTATFDLTGDTSSTTRPATAPAGFAPLNFSNVILTSTPADATGSGGVSTVFSSAGRQFTFGTGGNLVDPAEFDYEATGPDTARLTVPGEEGEPVSTTDLVFTGESTGTYTTVAGESTTTGTFGLATIPSSAPLANVSARTTVSGNGHTIVGFVIAGDAPRRVLIRAVGPGLAGFGVTPVLHNPALQLFRAGELIAANDDWGTLLPLPRTATAEGVASLSAVAATDAAPAITTDAPGATDTPATGTNSTPGTDPATQDPAIATGTPTGTDPSTDLAGTDPGARGDTSGNLLTGGLAGGERFTIALATQADFAAVGAFGLEADSRDAGLVATLPPGAYTVLVKRQTPAVAAERTTDATESNASGAPSGSEPAGSDTATGRENAPGLDGAPAGSGDVLVEVYFVE